MGRKKSSNNYFTDETEQAVRDYIRSTDDKEKNRIFNKHLYIPLKKICEIYCNTSQLSYIEETKEDLINDCLAHLMIDVIFKFNPESKSKAYSYFSVSAKYWFIQKNMRGYTKAKRKIEGLEVLENTEDLYYDNAQYNDELIKKYYAFLDWYKPLVPTFGFTKKMEEYIHQIIGFMYEFDEVELFLKKEVTAILKKINPYMNDTTARHARIQIYKQWLHFNKEWDEGEKNPKPDKKFLNTGKGINFNALRKSNKLYAARPAAYYESKRIKKNYFT